jgi:hypothetical protein
VIDFLVLGLPRSGTTWLANWLTSAGALCLHDPFARLLPEDVEAQRPDGQRLGVSCTGAFMLPSWIAQQDCPTAIIERDPAACDRSLSKIRLPAASYLRPALDATAGRRWAFADLWDEDRAAELWAFLRPDAPFDSPRYRLLRAMRVEPVAYTLDHTVVLELQRRGLFQLPPN